MIGRMLGAARLNTETYEDVESDRGATIQALLVVIIVTIASFIGDLLSSGDDINVIRSLITGLVLGVAGWAIWALVTWIVGATILKTEKTEADWGQLARGMGFAQTPKDPVRVCLHTDSRADHIFCGVHLVVRMHGGCRTAVPGLHIDVAGVLRDPDLLHSRGFPLSHRRNSSLPNIGQWQ